jgi:hypothetical protein
MNVFTAPMRALFPPHRPAVGSEDPVLADEAEDPFGGAVRAFLRVSLISCGLILAAGALFVVAPTAGARVLAVLGMDLSSAAFGALLMALALIFYLFIGRTIVAAVEE